jgi:hypothetical protein
MLRWSQISCKRAFEEVFVEYARSLKPGLLLGQWNHLGDFNQINGDERCMLPSEFWGRDEDYLWYSTGAAAHFTDLSAGILGEATLQARYVRGAFDNKPFTLGKYESTRIRVAIAELAANGGAPMGFYTRFKDPAARDEIVRYYRFLEKNADIYRGHRSHAEVLLLYPRSRVHEGDLDAVAEFKTLGKKLLDQHILFDILPDDLLTDVRRNTYRMVMNVSKPAELPKNLSRFDAPRTVRVSASQPSPFSEKGGEVILHFVNYNREEPKAKRSAGRGIQDEKPIAVESVKVDLALPAGIMPTRVDFLTPESLATVQLPHEVKDGRLHFTLPRFVVYGVVRIGKQ